MAEIVLSLENINKVYGVGEAVTVAVSEVNLAVRRGEWLAVTGPSGHGKSTLLQLMGGLEQPSRGRVRVDGADLSALSAGGLARLRARRIGFVFQFFNLLDHLTALENVTLALWMGDVPSACHRTRAGALLEQVGLRDKADRLPSTLSGGQQQRVAIARALANDPDILLMDEPTGNLDSASEESLLDLVATLHAAGKTLVMVTHNAAVAARAGRRILVRDGRVEI